MKNILIIISLLILFTSCQTSNMSNSDGNSMVGFYFSSSNVELWDFVPHEKHLEIIDKFTGDAVWDHAQKDIKKNYTRYIISTNDSYYVIWYKSKNEKKFFDACFGSSYYYDDIVHYFKVYKFIAINNDGNSFINKDLSQTYLIDKIMFLDHQQKDKNL